MRAEKIRIVAILFEASPGFGVSMCTTSPPARGKVAILFEASPGFGGEYDSEQNKNRVGGSQSSLKRVLVSESHIRCLYPDVLFFVAILFEASPGFGAKERRRRI